MDTPIIFKILIWLLLAFIVIGLIIIPIFFMLRDEPKSIALWFRSQQDKSTLYKICQVINLSVGQFICWLALFMVLTQFIVVIMRYVFSFGSIATQESIWYMHGILFMMALGYTLFKDGHVRLDVFYREASARTKAKVNLFGSIFFLLPLCIFTWIFSWGFVTNSWAVKEGSTEISGIPYLYLYKTVILIAFGLLFIQAIATIIQSIIELKSDDEDNIPPHNTKHDSKEAM